jgi:HlyD family secretion protein
MNFLNKIKLYIFAHKIISTVLLALILLVGYWGYNKITNHGGVTRYVLSAVTKDTIVSAITGSGQVSALNQIDLKPNVSGTITYISVKPGDKVGQGQTLFTIDDTTAQKAVRDAKINLQNVNLSLQKLQIQNSTANTDANLTKAYSDGFNTVSATFLDLPSTLTGINNMLAQNNLSDNAARNSGNTATNYRNTTETAYYSAQTAYDKNKNDFSTLDYNSKQSDLDALISKTYDTTQLLGNAIKDVNDYVNYLAQDTGRPADFTSVQSTLSTYTNNINGHTSALLAAEASIQSYKDSLPSNNIDMQSALISVDQKQNALTDTEIALADYSVRAPFAGTMASVPVQKGDNASSGTILGTIITTQQVATISLNEIDIAKIQLGQKVTLTFDAVPDLTITGKVAQIDSIGTVSQGVVNYNVKVNFDTNDQRIKPGMSVNSAIITNVAQDVLTMPSSAIKTTGGVSYVQMFDTALPAPLAGVQGSSSLVPPRNQTVEIGISNGTSTEITSGLKEGDEIVTKTITSTTKTTTTTTPSILGNPGGGNRGGGALRIGG